MSRGPCLHAAAPWPQRSRKAGHHADGLHRLHHRRRRRSRHGSTRPDWGTLPLPRARTGYRALLLPVSGRQEYWRPDGCAGRIRRAVPRLRHGRTGPPVSPRNRWGAEDRGPGAVACAPRARATAILRCCGPLPPCRGSRRGPGRRKSAPGGRPSPTRSPARPLRSSRPAGDTGRGRRHRH